MNVLEFGINENNLTISMSSEVKHPFLLNATSYLKGKVATYSNTEVHFHHISHLIHNSN